MRILFLDSYFYPEIIAETHLEVDFMQGLLNEGHEIFVVCPIPTRGIPKETVEKFRHIKRETLEGGIEVQRFWAPQEGRNPIIRALRYFWVNFRQLMIAKKYKDIDKVFCISTPPTQGMLSAMVAKKLSKKYKKKVDLIYNLQDIFPDSLVTTGLAKEDSFFWKIGSKIEKYTYENSDKIIVISEGFKRNILKKGVPEEKIEVVTNWIDTDAVKSVKRQENRLFDEFKLDRDKFTVVYAGNFGAAQGADVVLKAAEKLKKDKSIQFVVLGVGSEFEDAKEIVKTKKLKNVYIDDILPQERVSEVYSLGDVAVITCKKGVGGSGLPSKTWSIMACNTPIIAAFDLNSELAEIIEKADAGVCVEPENVDALVNAILDAKSNGFSKDDNHIREFVEDYASKTTCVAKYLEVMNGKAPSEEKTAETANV